MPVAVPVKQNLLRRLGFQWWWLIWVAAGLCILLCGVALGIAGGSGGPSGGWFGGLFTRPFGGRERVTILLVGVDNSSRAGLADTIMVAAVYPFTGEIGLLSVPRDSRAQIADGGVNRINTSHVTGGLSRTIRTVELLLGVPIDYSVLVDVSDMVEVVDAVGGVDLEVEKRMYYRDRSQNLLIDLQPGQQLLDGVQAMGYVRFRHDATGDIARTARQRKFIQVFYKKLTSPENAARLPQLAQMLTETVKTDLTAKDLLALKRIVDQNGIDSIRSATLPGTPIMVRGQSLLQIDPKSAQRVVDRILLGEGLAVTVLNGTDQRGLAARVATTLESYGCEVVNVENSPKRLAKTQIIDHRGGTTRARKVADWLGRGTVLAMSNGGGEADVTIIVGTDMAGSTR